jgi:hypothetical protein
MAPRRSLTMLKLDRSRLAGALDDLNKGKPKHLSQVERDQLASEIRSRVDRINVRIKELEAG